MNSHSAGSCRLLFFSTVRDAVGRAEMDWPLAGPVCAGMLVEELCTLHPALEPLRSSLLVAVNLSYVKLDSPVAPGDEVALMPPVQGG